MMATSERISFTLGTKLRIFKLQILGRKSDEEICFWKHPHFPYGQVFKHPPCQMGTGHRYMGEHPKGT